MTEPVLCLAGRGRKVDAITSRLFGKTEIHLRPTVWIHCGSSVCREYVRRTLDNLNFLRDFLGLLGPESLYIALNAPYPASGAISQPDLRPSTDLDDILLAIQSSVSTTFSGIKIKYTAVADLDAPEYSTLGGLIVVNGELFALTTAHALMGMLQDEGSVTHPATISAAIELDGDNAFGSVTRCKLEEDFGVADDLGDLAEELLESNPDGELAFNENHALSDRHSIRHRNNFSRSGSHSMVRAAKA